MKRQSAPPGAYEAPELREVELKSPCRKPRQMLGTSVGKIVAILLVASVLGGLGYLLYDLLQVPDYACPDSNRRLEVKSGSVTLRTATNGDVCVLKSTSGAIVGRSYDGNNWEATPSSSAKFSCPPGGDCSVELPAEEKFFLEKYTPSESSITSAKEKDIARFLIQATFGPKQSDIDNFGQRSFLKWIFDQIAEEPSLHRAYFRTRANPRSPMRAWPGRPKGPCEPMSRWHRFTFTEDDIGKVVTATEVGGGLVLLSIDGIDRTMYPTVAWNALGVSPLVEICSVIEKVGGTVTLGTNVNGSPCGISIQNPGILLTTLPVGRDIGDTLGGYLEDMYADIDDVKVLKTDDASLLSSCSTLQFGPVYARNGGLVYRHQRRLVLETNTLESPAQDSPPTFCSNVPKTFLNEESCVVGGGRGCLPRTYQSKAIQLNAANIRAFHEEAGMYVYVLQNLRLDNIGDPCASGTSRWKQVDLPCTETTGVETFTKALLVALIDAAPGGKVREIAIPGGATCSPANTKGATLQVGSLCFQHVHPDEHNVYDFSYWAITGSYAHPGNSLPFSQKKLNPIMYPADSADRSIYLNFPASHQMAQWETTPRIKIPLMGVFEAFVDFATLPTTVQNPTTAALFAVTEATNPQEEFVERCGSPGEVANDPNEGCRFTFCQYQQQDVEFSTVNSADYEMHVSQNKPAAWISLVLNAPDQLRQRMALALSEILVVTAIQVPFFLDEPFHAYHDIFVRNAFGNYRDVLREVSYSPMMAQMLSFMLTASIDYSYQTQQKEIFPDENYAREIMQLFTIGLLRLNNDGTVKKSADGIPLETYTNEDIFTFARVWTGFIWNRPRGNYEAQKVEHPANNIDPMTIIPERRDLFPKMNLYKGHLGDGLPLCVDLPKKMFLREGAKWRYLGTYPLSQLQTDHHSFAHSANLVVLDQMSALYGVLCNEQEGTCRYKSSVVLSRNLVCNGVECDIESARVVKVKDVFYEYVQPACASFDFFENGKKAMKAVRRGARCVDSRAMVATASCCIPGDDVGYPECNFLGERVDYESAVGQCSAVGRSLCEFNNMGNTACNPLGAFWTNNDCEVKMRVRSDGHISILHDLTSRGNSPESTTYMLGSVADGNKNFFRVNWLGGNFPTVQNGCLNGLCQVHQDEFCLCKMNVDETAVFSAMPSKEQVEAELHIGSLAPDVYTNKSYSLYGFEGGVKLFAVDPSAPFAKDSIFEVIIRGKPAYFRNMKSMVHISQSVGFRNPANIMNLGEPTLRDAQYETEAFLDHLIYHENTPPFIAYRIIQRFVTSNPTPRYVDVVATAFSSGMYSGVGTGNYGDLSATIAAVLLDREARSVILDQDPAFGQLREPLIKFIHMMRSLDTKSEPGRQIVPFLLHTRIAQEPHLAPNVFSYFRPEFTPPGLVAKANLVAPEAQVFKTPKVVLYTNAMVSSVKFGLGHCYGGFTEQKASDCGLSNIDGLPKQFNAHAKLTWLPKNGVNAPKEEVVEELDLLLTAGRLEPAVKEVLFEAYDDAFASAIRDDIRSMNGIIAVQQLLLTSPDFQVTNVVHRVEGERRPQAEKRNGTEPYKAVVVLFLNGGCDSYNLLIPHSNCKNGKNMFEEYQQVRTDIALNKNDLLPIAVPNGTQVCDTFGLHPRLSNIQQFYNDGDALFLANVGVMVEPVTKQELLNEAKRIPESLFAHNIQQQSTQTLQPQDRSTVGVLGRAHDALWQSGYSAGSFSLSSGNYALEPEGKISPAQVFMSDAGVNAFNPSKRPGDMIDERMFQLSQNVSQSLYAETWASTFESAFNETQDLSETMGNAQLEGLWEGGHGPLSAQLKQVALLISARKELELDRQAFFVEMYGFDTHSDNGPFLNYAFDQINQALHGFVKELKLQGVWDDVLIVQASDFGRTITSNGAGTDHGWGGHYMLLGGGVKGSAVLGEYPDDLTSSGELNIGRGRFIPSVSWDAVWNAIASWYGVGQKQMAGVIPNIGNYKSSDLFAASDLFTNAPEIEADKPEDTTIAIVLAVTAFLVLASIAAVAIFMVRRQSKQRRKMPSASTILEAPTEDESW